MTGNSDKLRSLFLTALMVFSVFASTVAFSGGAAAVGNVSIEQAVEYTGNNGNIVELALSQGTSNAITSDEVTLYLDGEANPSSLDNTPAIESDGQNGRLAIDIGSDVTPNRNLTVKIDNSGDAGGGVIVAEDIDVTSRTFNPDASDRSYTNVYRGETVAIEETGATDSTNVLVEQFEGSVVADDTYAANSEVYVLDTSNLDTGQRYNITTAGSDTAGFRISDLGLDVQVEDTDVTAQDDIIVNATARRGGEPATATLLDSDGDEVTSTVNTLRSNDRVDFNLGNHSAEDGPYTVEVTDNQTGVTVESNQINVSEAEEGDASFNQSVVSDEVGDVANITVNVDNTEDATLFVGDDDDDNYAIQAQLTDDNEDGKIVAQFNSYAAGNSSATVLTAAGEDDVTIEGQFGSFSRGTLNSSDMLEASSYSMNVTSGTSPNYGNADTVGTLRLNERSTESIQSWTAPSGTDITDEDIGVYERIGSNLTQSTQIAEGDVVVHQVQASGIEGALQRQLEDKGASDATEAFLQAAKEDGPLNLTVNKTNVGANTDPLSMRLNASNTDVVEDSNNNTYFVAVDTGNVEYGDGTPVREDDNDDQITANFSAKEGALSDSGADSVETNYRIVDRDATINTDSEGFVTVQAAANQQITGTTTVAPGTELTVRIDSESESNPFILRPEATVDANGTFTATEDFSDQSAGVNFTAQARINGNNIGDEEDGRIVQGERATVSISDQESNGTQVVVDSAQLSAGGFVVIHDSTLLEGEVAGSVIGSSEYLEAGSHEDITVTLDEPQDSNFTAIAMPHKDTNGNQAYDFPDADGPYTQNGSAVTASANVTVTGEPATETPTGPTETETPETETPETETETPPPETETTATGTEAGTTPGTGPGFTAAIALIALVAAALLAVRRDN